MGTAHLQNGYRFVINTNDHNPPHVHVVKNDGVLVVYLNGEDGREAGVLWVRESHNLKAQEERRALEMVRENHALLLAKWGEIHDENF